jgi:signal transduction histidine kinase/ActR/RegA family two-component response regulator
MIRQETSKLARWVVVAGIALTTLIVAADVHDAWLDYRSALSQNERIQQALGRVLAEQTARMMQEADVVMSDYADWVMSNGGLAIDEQTLRERLRADVMRLPFVFSAAVAGTDGRVRVTTEAATDREGVNVPAPALKDSLYIGPLFIGRRDGARTFALSRRIEGSGGALTGVVVARIAFEYLTGFYSSVNATPDTSIRLLRDDGVVLAQYPAGTGPIPDAPIDASRANEQVQYRTADGRDQVTAVHAVDGYPVIVEVTRPLSSVLRKWADDELGGAVRTFVLVAFAVLLLVALRAALIRHAREEQERRRLERDLENARRMDALGVLAASVAHDFNNVLSAIVGYGELAHKSMAAGSEEIANTERLLAAAERARLLVRRVLTFDPRRSLHYAPLPLGPIIAEVAQQSAATMPPSVSVSVSGLDSPIHILGDATEIHQVVMNLCTNAVHAMPSGGRLTIHLDRVELQETQQLTLGRLVPGHWARLAISDTGVGLSTEQIGSIFEPFYTTRRSEQGTGIGLTVVRNILSRMHGALDVQSRLGEGTRIAVYWLCADSGGVSADLTGDTRQGGHGETVMIVDDKPELVSLAEEVLASLGYEPVGFTSSRDAFAAFRRDPRRFDAVITDERMESLSGCDLAKKIHKIEPSIPVILVTGYRDADLLLRAKAAGVVEILDKPLSTLGLSAALSRILIRPDGHS